MAARRISKRRVVMHRSVQTAQGDTYQQGGCYELPYRLAATWTRYGVCSPAPADAVLHKDAQAATKAQP